jgi:hypothetical protein
MNNSSALTFIAVVLLLAILFYTIQNSPKPSMAQGGGEASLSHINPANPYHNTLPYDTQVRYQKPKVQYFADDSVERIFKGVDEMSEGWFFNTVPDPTLMARPVHWTQDSRPDIVSKEADCSYRFCY